MFIQKFLISVVLVGCCCSIPASATLVTYCSVTGCSATSAAFVAATTADTFQNVDVTAGSLGDPYTDPDTGLAFFDPLGLTGSLTAPSGWPAGTSIASNAGVSTMTITLPSAVDVVDFYVGMLDFSNFTISVTDSSGGTFSSGYFAQNNVMNPLFFGVTTDSTFTSFTITSQASIDQITLDGISVSSAGTGGDPAPTPEAATLLLVATGLFLMNRFGRRKKRRLAAQAASSIDQAASRGTVRTMSTGITPA